jgi:hypothetical protein
MLRRPPASVSGRVAFRCGEGKGAIDTRAKQNLSYRQAKDVCNSDQVELQRDGNKK